MRCLVHVTEIAFPQGLAQLKFRRVGFFQLGFDYV